MMAVTVEEGGSGPASAINVAKKPGKKKKGDPEVTISLSNRKGKKSATVVLGADLFGVKLADVAKLCKKKFSCGCTVSKDASQAETIEIQGDRRRETAELLVKEFSVPESVIFIFEDKKTKVAAFG